MFNFFKRSRREDGSEKKLVKDEAGGRPTRNSFKNNLPQGGIVLAGNEDCRDSCNGVTTIDDQTNEKPRMLSYAGTLKKSEAKGGQNVKPCGHGTVAISPRVPLAISKKNENQNQQQQTPPSSPKLETKLAPTAAAVVEVKPTPRCKKNERKGSLKEKNRPVDGYHLKRQHSADNPPHATNGQQTHDDKDQEDDTKNLINQEAKFQSQLNELSKQLSQRDGEANKLRFQQEELQRDVFAKSAGMDRLQAELQAAHKESEYVKQRLRNLEDDLQEYRRKNEEISEELTNKTESYAKKETEAGTRINELERVIGELKVKIGSLEMQIEELQKDKRQLEIQQKAILEEREKEKQLVEVALQEALKEKENVNKKWEEEFEKLRTVSILKEQQLLDDFEWKLREVEKTCKGRLIEKDKTVDVRIQEAYKDAEAKMKLAHEMMDEVEHLKRCETEMGELKDKSKQQEKSLEHLREQQEQMRLVEQSLKDEAKKLRSLIDLEKENLQHMQRVHNQEIIDKERWLQNTLDEKKTEIAVYWEERLLHEIGRLKYELEQLYFEEKQTAVENVRAQKEEEFQEAKKKWEEKVEECLRDIAALKTTLDEKERVYHEDMVTQQTVTDRDILELRRIMDKIDNAHHERFEKLMMDNEKEIERINEEHDLRVKEVETGCQNQMSSLRTTLELVKEQMERESQQKIQSLIQQHRSELDAQWDNLIHQKSEAIKLVEDEYVNKYKTLEEQFYTQQKSHEAREVELLKSIDSLKNDVSSKSSTIDDLQNNVDVLEGGVQVLNEEIANQGQQLEKNRKDADQKIRGLQDVLIKLQALQAQEKEELQMKFNQQQKQYQTTIDHLQRKCTTLTKLFEEVRGRYERRDSRQEDLNLISDLRQVIAEQEKDMACMNEEKRFYQMKLLKLQRSMDGEGDDEEDDEDDELEEGFHTPPRFIPNQYTQPQPICNNNNNSNCTISIPPTIPECDDCDEEQA